VKTSEIVNSRGGEGGTSTGKLGAVVTGTVKKCKMAKAGPKDNPGDAAKSAEDGEWKTVGPGPSGKDQVVVEGLGGDRADRRPSSAKQDARKTSPTRKLDGKTSIRGGTGKASKCSGPRRRPSGVPTAKELPHQRSASAVYPAHGGEALRAGQGRPFKAHLRSLPAADRTSSNEEEHGRTKLP
jgi:hypothetical protein